VKRPPWEWYWDRPKCNFCEAVPGTPCIDKRWDGRHYRWCRHPHPERKALPVDDLEIERALDEQADADRAEQTADEEYPLPRYTNLPPVNGGPQ
jgi:hypothetical protein